MENVLTKVRKSLIAISLVMMLIALTISSFARSGGCYFCNVECQQSSGSGWTHCIMNGNCYLGGSPCSVE